MTSTAHTLDLKEIIVHSYLRGETMGMITGTFRTRETLLPLRSLIFIGGMGAKSRVHILVHLAVDVAF